MEKLTPKQKAFADLWLQTHNATQSYIDAGYKATTREVAEANARKLLGHNSVDKYIKERLSKIENNRIMKADEVLELFSNIARGKIKEIGMDRAGNIVEAPAAIRDRIRAAELLGKSYKLFIDKIENDTTITDVNVKIEVVD